MTMVWMCLMCALLQVPLCLFAQDTLQVAPGARIRARIESSETWTTGRLVAYGPDSLRVRRCTSCSIEAYSLGSVTAVQVSVGRAPRAATILGVALGGAALGTLLGYEHGQRAAKHCGDGPCLAPGFEPVLGGLGGLVVGFAVGVSIRYDQWRPALIVSRSR